MSLKKLKRGLKKVAKVAVAGIVPPMLTTRIPTTVEVDDSSTVTGGGALAAQPNTSKLETFAPKDITTGGASFYRKDEDEEDSNLAGTAGTAGTAIGFKKGGMVKKSSPARSVVGCAKRGFGKALMKGR